MGSYKDKNGETRSIQPIQVIHWAAAHANEEKRENYEVGMVRISSKRRKSQKTGIEKQNRLKNRMVSPELNWKRINSIQLVNISIYMQSVSEIINSETLCSCQKPKRKQNQWIKEQSCIDQTNLKQNQVRKRFISLPISSICIHVRSVCDQRVGPNGANKSTGDSSGL